MNNKLKGLLFLLATQAVNAQAQNWPQPESAYMPATQSPQWVESAMHNLQTPQMPPPFQAPQYRAQPAMPYPMPNYGYMPYPQPYYGAPQMPYAGNSSWGNWPNRNNMMPGMPSMPNMGNWSTPNMNMGNWSMPDMPNMNNMPGMPNMDNFSMPSPSFEMPSPSFTTPTMNMPFFN